MDRDLKKRLDRIEAKLDVLLDESGLESPGPKCAHCGSENVEDTSTTTPRLTCLECGRSDPSEEALNG